MNQELTIKGRLFAAVCTKTGKGFNSGFICADGTSFEKASYLIEDLRKCSPERTKGKTNKEVLLESYNLDEYYYTDFECIEHMNYIEIDGKMYEIEINPINKY